MTEQHQRERKLQAHRLRMTMLGVGNTTMEASVMLLYLHAGELTLGLWLAFVGGCIAAHGTFALIVYSGLNLRLKEPSMLMPQIVAGCALQLVFLVLLPQLSFLFLIGLCVTYIFAMFSFNPRQYFCAWLLMGLGAGAAFYLARGHFRYPAVNDSTTFALWLYFILTIRQLTAFGAQFSRLRLKLSMRNQQLSESLAKLEDLAGQQRLVERERIARELHDTLLQGIQGLILRFQSATQRLDPDDPARRIMEQALDRADQVLVDGRDQLAGLRVASSAGASLPEALATAGEELSADHDVPFSLQLHGSPCLLQAEVADEAYRIGREALLNAFQHSGATRIKASLTFAADALQLSIVDDGRGIDPSALKPRGMQRHWGVPGMQERALRLGGRLVIEPLVSGGTRVELVVPGPLAYEAAGTTDEDSRGLAHFFRLGRAGT